MSLFVISRQAYASPIDGFNKMSCEELNALVENIFDNELLETEEIKNGAEKIYKAILEKNCTTLPDALNLVGFYCYNKNEPVRAKYYLNRADSLLQVTGQQRSKAAVRNMTYLGLNAQIGGNHKASYYYYEKALSLSKEIAFSYGIMQSYINQSLYFLKKEDTKKAKEFLIKAEQYKEGNPHMSGYLYHNLSRVYLIEKDYEEALKNIKIAEKIWTDLGFSKGLYFINSNLAHIDLKYNKDTLQWKSHMDQALLHLERDGSYSRHGIYKALAWYHTEKKEEEDAIHFFEKALEESASFEENELLDIVGALIELYGSKDDIENIKRLNQSAIKVFDQKSEMYKAEADKWLLTELTLENKIGENEFLKFRNKAFLTSWILTVGFLLVFGFILFKYYRQKGEQKRLEDAQEFRSMISSNLHDNVGSTLAGLAMKSEILSLDVDNELKDELIGISEISRHAMTSLRDTVWAVDIRKDSYKNLTIKMLDHGEEQLSLKNINFTNDIKCTNPEAYIDPELRQNIYLIFKEAITNILKHSNADIVHLKVRQSDKKYKLSIMDNGDTSKSSVSSGSGLANMEMRAKNIGATLKIDSDNGFKISLKYNIS